MFLISPDKATANESLESFLIRLCKANGFESYQTMALVIRDWLQDNDHEAAGSWPLTLSCANIYHANHSSGFRVRAFKLLDELLDTNSPSMLERCLLNTTTAFSPNLASVSQRNIIIPLKFIRTSTIPVCPQCLTEHQYIPQLWHISPYEACHHHKCELITHCPSCNEQLNYLQAERITHCECGYDLRLINTIKAPTINKVISEYIAGKDVDCLPLRADMSERFGIILWYQNRYLHSKSDDDSSLISFFEHWPQSFFEELDDLSKTACDKQLKSFNKTDFSVVFGDVLASCQKLPFRTPQQNIVLEAVVDYLISLVEKNPKCKVANLGDLQLNIIETAALLSTSIEQVYRLIEEGYLQLAIKLKLHSRLSPNQGAFYLRQVIELRQSRITPTYSNNMNYLPSW